MAKDVETIVSVSRVKPESMRFDLLPFFMNDLVYFLRKILQSSVESDLERKGNAKVSRHKKEN